MTEQAEVMDEEMLDVTVATLSPVLEGEARTRAQLRVIEALLFASAGPLDIPTIERHLNRGPLGEGADIRALLSRLQEEYAGRGIDLIESGARFSLRTASDLANYLRHETVKPVKLSRAMAETLAVIAYHQPVTRAEVEAIRGVATSKGILDYLMQLGWARPGRRRETPGRPLTWITTPVFLDHFGLSSTNDLPGMEELRATGLLDTQAGPTYGVLTPSDEAELPPPVDENFESEPEFLPSEETVAAEVATEVAPEVEIETIVDGDAEELLEEITDDDDDDFDDEDDEDDEEEEAALLDEVETEDELEPA